jgi:signal transduction histidine kinase
LTLWLIVVVLLGTVGIGGALILKSINYEMKLASRKTDFVGNVSHELKTPLTSIRMFSELLAGNETRDPDQTRNYSEVISRESARLTRLINRLLDFSRLDRGEMKLRNEKIDLGSLVEETVAVYHPETDSTNWNVHLDLTPGSFVKGDRDSLSQVIWNLLSNAEKYAPEGEEVLVEVRDDDSKNIILAVHDRGEGISSAHQRKIFEKFYRVDDSIDSGVEGSGIGLALCRQIIEQLGGTITYRHRSGGGSTFIATLPKDET